MPFLFNDFKIRKTARIILACLSTVLMIYFFSGNIFAAVMSSSNYAIQSDDLTPSGGENLSSANYIFKDTLGEVSTGPSASTSYGMKAGYQEMQETYLAVSAPSAITMTPAIGGVSGGTATGSSSDYVITDNLAGFSMKINSSTSPSMTLTGDITHYFDNYTATGTPAYQWNVVNAAKFGYTVAPGSQGGLSLAFHDNGSVCGSGSGSGNCWNGFTTAPVNIVSTTSRTNNSPGELETVSFKAQSNNTVLEEGGYQATIITTVSAN